MSGINDTGTDFRWIDIEGTAHLGIVEVDAGERVVAAFFDGLRWLTLCNADPRADGEAFPVEGPGEVCEACFAADLVFEEAYWSGHCALPAGEPDGQPA